MSSTILKIIPEDPTFVPETTQLENAKLFVEKLYTSDQIEFNISENIEFIDQGENFEKVSCNICGQIIGIEDWQNVMDKSYERHFKDLEFTTLCCHKKTSLNDLKYHWPAGFAKFSVTITDPEKEIEEGNLIELRRILGTKLRLVWGHY